MLKFNNFKGVICIEKFSQKNLKKLINHSRTWYQEYMCNIHFFSFWIHIVIQLYCSQFYCYVYHWMCGIVVIKWIVIGELCNINTVIFFLKLLWNSLHCIKHYINQCDLTWWTQRYEILRCTWRQNMTKMLWHCVLCCLL